MILTRMIDFSCTWKCAAEGKMWVEGPGSRQCPGVSRRQFVSHLTPAWSSLSPALSPSTPRREQVSRKVRSSSLTSWRVSGETGPARQSPPPGGGGRAEPAGGERPCRSRSRSSPSPRVRRKTGDSSAPHWDTSLTRLGAPRGRRGIRDWLPLTASCLPSSPSYFGRLLRRHFFSNL